jgi:hypothetical protein
MPWALTKEEEEEEEEEEECCLYVIIPIRFFSIITICNLLTDLTSYIRKRMQQNSQFFD